MTIERIVLAFAGFMIMLTLALGIPGSVIAAILIAAFVLHGLMTAPFWLALAGFAASTTKRVVLSSASSKASPLQSFSRWPTSSAKPCDPTAPS